MAPACRGSELRGGGGQRTQRLPSAGSQGTLAPPGPPPAGWGPDGSFVQLQRTEGEAGVLTSPANAGLRLRPSSACPNVHLSASAIECPPAARLSSESLDAPFKQRNGSGSFRICRVHRGERSGMPRGGGGKAGPGDTHLFHEGFGGDSWVLRIVLGLTGTPGAQKRGVPCPPGA